MIELYTCEDNAKNSYPGDGLLVMERSPKLQSKNASSQNAPNHFSRHTLAAIESIQWISQTERNFIICHSHGSGAYLSMKNFQIYLLPLELPNDDRQKMNFSVCKPSGTLQLEKFTTCTRKKPPSPSGRFLRNARKFEPIKHLEKFRI